MTRLGFYIIHNNRKKIVHIIDVPWDFILNKEDGSIQPNPLPPSEEVIDGFSWNDITAEKVILYIRSKVFWIPEYKPYILRYATFIMSFPLAEKLGIINIIDKEKIEDRPYLKEYKDINSVLYITNEEMNEDEVRVVTRRKDVIYDFQGEYPDFNEDDSNNPNSPDNPENPNPNPNPNPDSGSGNDSNEGNEGNNEGIALLNYDSPYMVNEEILEDLLVELSKFTEGNIQVYIPFEKAFSSGLLEETEIESDAENDFYIYYYKGNKIIFSEGKKVTNEEGEEICNPNNFMWIIPLPSNDNSDNGNNSNNNSSNKIQVTFKDNSIEVKEIKELTNDENFILWFRKYFYSKLIKDDSFLSHFNTERNYYIISQENKNIMGLMTLYKGRSILNFMNHDYKDLIERRFPNIRNDMIIKDESFGGFDDDKLYQQDVKLPTDDSFGGFGGDEGFLI